MNKLKGVAVGLGYFSQFHLEAWSRIVEVELVAICDSDIGKAKHVASTYGICKFYDDVDTLLIREQPDFIDIITPPQSHLELCRLAAEKGVNIICQKPLAPS